MKNTMTNLYVSLTSILVGGITAILVLMLDSWLRTYLTAGNIWLLRDYGVFVFCKTWLISLLSGWAVILASRYLPKKSVRPPILLLVSFSCIFLSVAAILGIQIGLDERGSSVLLGMALAVGGIIEACLASWFVLRRMV